MSDERKKVKSSRTPPEWHDKVAARLGFKPSELVGVYSNDDGAYALVKDGHRLLLLEDGGVAWYGDKAPNPSYPLVVPSVELDESDADEAEAEDPEDVDPPAASPAPEGGPARLAVPPKHGAGSGKEPWATYAAENQVAVPENATREQIWHLLEQANIPTE